MEQTTPPQTADLSSISASGKTPFPEASSAASRAGSPQPEGTSAAAGADDLLQRLTRRAHDVVDGVADRVSSAIGGAQGGLGKVGDARDEWIESAREAIRQHPFAALGTALLVGIALRSLGTSRDR